MTHGTRSHIRPVYEILKENGALRINSITLTDYRKRHVQMIRRYLAYSDINKVYVPVPANAYDTEVLNMLYYLSILPLGSGTDTDTDKKNFELIQYGGSLQLDDVLITVDTFNYNRMLHTTISFDYANAKLLYLAIGYKEGYELFTGIKNQNYDIVFYGTHKHNERDDNYTSDIYGSFAGVLSSYLDNDKKRASQNLDANAVDFYRRSDSVLFMSDNYDSIIFDVRKNGGIKYYLK